MRRISELLRLEERPTSLARLGKIALFAVPLVVVLVGFVPPLIVAYQYAALSPGDRAITVDIYDGFEGEVSAIEDGVVTIKAPSGETRQFPESQVREL